MTDSGILNLLDRRGVWMTAVEIFHASPDYPMSEYVSNELRSLKAHGMVASRVRLRTSLTEYGLPTWVNAPEPAFSARYFAHLLRQVLRAIKLSGATT